MAIEDSYPGTVIHWGGEYWTPTEAGELEPLAVMYHSLVNREQFVETGLKLERRSLDSYYATPVGRRARAAGTEQLYRMIRMQKREGELINALPGRFDGKYDELCAYALGSGPLPERADSDE